MNILNEYLIFEDLNNLFNDKIKNIQYWQFIREMVYNKIINYKGLSHQATKGDKNASYIEHLSALKNYLFSMMNQYKINKE